MVQAKMAQFRFYGLGNQKNYPAVTFEQNDNGTTVFPWTDNLFEGYGNIIKVGIQTLPGVKFSFGTGDLSNPANSIIIDYTGIYELDLRNVSAQINTLRFDADSLLLIHSNDNASIIVDIAYFTDSN